ncbi:DUF2057 domain-containing protein [Vibrio anguillarum]|nr:DUF2057 domain-containing protein [Vibrio anguillarum]
MGRFDLLLRAFICILVFLCSSTVANGYELSVDSGIEILYVNGQKADNSLTFDSEYLQLVLRYSGRLKSGGKMEYYATYPYLVTLTFQGQKDINSKAFIKLISNRYDKINAENERKKPVFDIQTSEDVSVEQKILPSTVEVFPYMDVGSLVKSYNIDNAIFFSDNLKKIDMVNNSDAISTTEDSLTQLQIWYLKSTKEERKSFRKWIIEQE